MKFIILLTFLSISCGGELYIPGEGDLSGDSMGEEYTNSGPGDTDTYEDGDKLQQGDTDFGHNDTNTYEDGDGLYENDDNDTYYNKIIVCHSPPGNNKNKHSISIPYKDLQDHIKHGDYVGKCK